MSMLAEHKRKTKWVINPTKRPLWTTDSSGIQFGKQLMEKMGWSAGKGLGVNEQGIQEPLKVAFKNDNKGMGFKENLDDWIEHQDEFNILLNQLRSNNEISDIKDSGEEKTEIKSLEEKSKQSKARVHYQKFTRGKDLSKYSANDLACILGTSKTRKEKQKTEDVIETETKVNGNCETSFGVTTINSGSIQDYFKKKWIIDKVKSSNFDSAGDDKFEVSKEDLNNENWGFSVQDEGTTKFENEEKKSKKRKHMTSSDFEPLCAEETKLTELDETESIEKVEKRKKKKKNQEEHERNERGCVDENLSDKQHFVLEESLSKSSNTVKKRKKDKNHKLEIASSEGESKSEIKSKKAKKIIEESTIQEELPAEKIYDTNNEDSTLESIKRKKKKKDKKKIEGTEKFDSHCDAVDMNAVEPVQNKERKKRESDMSEGNNNKDFSSVQDIVSRNHIKDSSLNIEEPEELLENKDALDIKPQKKKNKKKDKKENIEKFDKYFYNNNQEMHFDDKFELDIANLRKINGDILESASEMKKKKKKKVKVDENEMMAYEDHQNQIEECSEKIVFDSQGEDTSVVESVKKKKKNKNKKEKSIESEECSLEEEKRKAVFEEENTANIEFKKKKKKKEKKEVEEIESKSDQVEHTNIVKNNSVGDRNEIEKSGTGVICSTNYNSSNSNIEGRVLNTNTEVENRLEKISANLFGDKAAEKYFPEQHCNERVLKLIRWANISEFRGSNLKDVDGYGRRKEYEKQFR